MELQALHSLWGNSDQDPTILLALPLHPHHGESPVARSLMALQICLSFSKASWSPPSTLLRNASSSTQVHPWSSTIAIKQGPPAAVFMLGWRSRTIESSSRSLITMAPGTANSSLRDKFIVCPSHLKNLIAPLYSNTDAFSLKQLNASSRILSTISISGHSDHSKLCYCTLGPRFPEWLLSSLPLFLSILWLQGLHALLCHTIS